MQTTTNIGLKTYEANDPTDWLGEFNYNMNKIDTAVGAQNDAIDVIEETAGNAVTTANTASATATQANQNASQALEATDSLAELTNITLLTTDWVTNTDVTTSTDYPFICTKSSTKFSNTSKPIYQILGAGTIPTIEELTEAGYISVVNFTDSGIVLYATEKPLNTLTLVIKGV